MRILLIPAGLVLLILLAGPSVRADSTKVETQIIPELTAYRINPHPPVIDGYLNDSIWISPHIEQAHFRLQRDPTEGLPVTESTTVAVAYDDQALYVAFWCYDDEPDKIVRQLVRRDRSSETDRVTVRIDPFHDHQNGNAFEVNASGVQRDCRYYNENNSDMDWDAVWESAVKQQPWGWTAEIKIPYYCLRFGKDDLQTWGIDFIRYITRKNEIDGWAFTPAANGGFVSNFGHLNGLKGVKPSSHMEILPYLVSSELTDPKSPGNPDGREFTKNAGLDLKYGIASNLVLDATFNPDFGQVELDQPVLNLSTYETFFAEKRPFFLEGADLFQTDFTLFYSRRIGRSPQGSIADPEYIYSIISPRATSILGAAKLTGKLFSRTSVALLTTVTQREYEKYAARTNLKLDSTWSGDTLHTTVISADTVTRRGVVEPEANYSVLRIKQELFKNSSVGAIVTVADQKNFRPATTGGIDWRLITNDNNWGAYGQIVFSRVNNPKTGYGIDLTLEKRGGKHIRGAVGLTVKSRDLQLNRLGYTNRADIISHSAWLQYYTIKPWWIFKESYNNLNFYPSWNFDGTNIGLGGNFNTTVVFTNYWSLGGGVEIQGEKYSDLETRGRGLWIWPVRPTLSWWFSLNTDYRKKLGFNWNPGAGSDRGGHWWANYFGATLRPRSNMEFSAGMNFKRYRDILRWVRNTADSSVFAHLNNDEIYLEASANVVLNRDLSIQLSAQGLVSGLDYSGYRYYRGNGDYSLPVNGFNSDYNYSEMNSTLLLRWEYRPGSTLYLVWTRSRPDYDPTVNDMEFSRDIKRLFSGNAHNLFLIKTSYWMNI
ncbi:conserved exported hypothetical protein [Candidatus Zixiibacteriota bacterium]|nr:conserved exported hypothetical protein [candidate division Zixibacteria bacterium]